MDMMTRKASPHHIVFANEKGGTGKSTSAVHVAVALSYLGFRVGAIDLDPRQRTLHRYLENRVATQQRRSITLPTPNFEVFQDDTQARLEQMVTKMSQDCD
ncbi:division plane positioning ATPase MipZ, partial [Blastomonas fulva]